MVKHASLEASSSTSCPHFADRRDDAQKHQGLKDTPSKLTPGVQLVDTDNLKAIEISSLHGASCCGNCICLDMNEQHNSEQYAKPKDYIETRDGMLQG